jgi:hypothetical protein
MNGQQRSPFAEIFWWRWFLFTGHYENLALVFTFTNIFYAKKIKEFYFKVANLPGSRVSGALAILDIVVTEGGWRGGGAV